MDCSGALQGGAPVDFSDAFLREMVAKMGSGMADPAKDYLDVPSQGWVAALTDHPTPHTDTRNTTVDRTRDTRNTSVDRTRDTRHTGR